MKKILVLTSFFAYLNVLCQNIDTSLTNLSRKSALKIMAFDNNKEISVGTGFFIEVHGIMYVVSCLHVVSKITQNPNHSTNYILYRYIKGVTYNGDTIDLNMQAIDKTGIPLEYMERDFCVLKEKKKTKAQCHLSILPDSCKVEVGDFIYVSGYPLNCPLLTHNGMVSGFSTDSGFVFIQSPFNEGNSGRGNNK